MQIEAVGLNEDEMTLVRNASRPHSKGTMSDPTRTNQGESAHASSVVRLVILLHNVLIMMIRHKNRAPRGRSFIIRRKVRRTSSRSGI